MPHFTILIFLFFWIFPVISSAIFSTSIPDVSKVLHHPSSTTTTTTTNLVSYQKLLDQRQQLLFKLEAIDAQIQSYAQNTGTQSKTVNEGEAENVSPDSSLYWFFIFMSLFCTLFAGLMSGLTLGLLSLSHRDLEILESAGTPEEKAHAQRVF